MVSPRGQTRLQGWDQVTVLAHFTDEETIRQALLTPFRQAMGEEQALAP